MILKVKGKKFFYESIHLSIIFFWFLSKLIYYDLIFILFRNIRFGSTHFPFNILANKSVRANKKP